MDLSQSLYTKEVGVEWPNRADIFGEIMGWSGLDFGEHRDLAELWTDCQNNRKHYVWGVEDFKKLKALSPPAPWFKYTCEVAVRRNDTELVRWLRSQNPPCPWGDSLQVATRKKNYELVNLLSSLECPWEDVMGDALSKQDEDMIKFLRSCDPPCPWGDTTNPQRGRTFREHNRALTLERLTWSRSMHVPWDEDTCSAVLLSRAPGDDFEERLKWLRTQDPPCPWGTMSCARAIRNVDFKFVKLLRKWGCPWGDCIPGTRLTIDTLEWLGSNGCDWDITCSMAQDRETVEWLRSQDPPCPWGDMNTDHVFRLGTDRYETLRWLLRLYPKCPWGEPKFCHDAIMKGDVGTLKWLRSLDPPCPWGYHSYDIGDPSVGDSVYGWLKLNGCPGALGV